jgi:hypothetical protein
MAAIAFDTHEHIKALMKAGMFASVGAIFMKLFFPH